MHTVVKSLLFKPNLRLALLKFVSSASCTILKRGWL
jgi:hypothetical protein